MKRLVLSTLSLALLLCAALSPSAGGNTALAATAAANTQDPATSDGVARITLDELKALLASGKPVTVIDVRYGSSEKIKGAVNIPLGDFESRVGEIPRDREIVTYCA
ncbi:MAG: hypothetical protein LC754_16950 [Acidobacteria bacterium]|nr:hypothetical protein [Acidobacteriota bacterium]